MNGLDFSNFKLALPTLGFCGRGCLWKLKFSWDSSHNTT